MFNLWGGVKGHRFLGRSAMFGFRGSYLIRQQGVAMRAETTVDESTIYDTPLLEFDLELGSGATVLGKAEWFNLVNMPHGGGSVKSRIAKGMLDAAESAEALDEDTVIIEASSGNTGSEIARIGCSRGYDVEIVMPDNSAGGKIDAVEAAGATIHFVDGDLGYDAVLDRCNQIIDANPGRYYQPNQYENPANPGTHARTTAPEIFDATSGTITHFIAGAGTGGTITGTGRGLLDRDETIQIIGFEPEEPLHAIDGLKYLRTGDHYHPGIYDESVLDQKRYVNTSDAYERARELRSMYQDRPIEVYHPGAHDEGTLRPHLRVQEQFLVGTSSGAALQVVYDLDAEGLLHEDDVVALMLCDRGDKYADIPLWEDYLDSET